MNEFNDNQYYSYPYHCVPGSPDSNNMVVPIVSTIGKGPKGDKGEAGVLKFGRDGEDSVVWNNSAAYDAGTFVMNSGSAYVSVKDVPAGAAISDTTYWLAVGNENVEYQDLSNRITTEASDRAAGDAANTTALANEVSTINAAIQAVATNLSTEITDRAQGDANVTAAVSSEASARAEADTNLNTAITNLQQQLTTLSDQLTDLTSGHDILYNDPSGTNGTVDWTNTGHSSDSYDYMRIFYVNNLGHHSSVTVYKPSGKKVALGMLSNWSGDQAMWLKQRTVYIGAYTMTTDGASQQVGVSTTAGTVYSEAINLIYVTRVEAWNIGD